MLVLSRKLNERVVIGDMIEVAVLGIIGDKVKLGFSAPKAVSVHRKEIYDIIMQQNIDASKMDLAKLESIIRVLKKD